MIQLKNVTKKYGNLLVIENFNLSIDSGEIACLFGPSGCGKTTLLNIISGLIKCDSGSVMGVEAKKLSYIFQETRLLPWSTVEENILFVLRDKYNKEDSQRIANEYLELVNLSEYKDFYPSELSGGMKQRVSIARAFAYESDIILMDEPFKGLDIELKRNLINAFISLWQRKNITVVFVTHDMDEALLLSDTIYILEGRPAVIKDRIKIAIPQDNRTTENIHNIYKYDSKNLKECCEIVECDRKREHDIP